MDRSHNTCGRTGPRQAAAIAAGTPAAAQTPPASGGPAGRERRSDAMAKVAGAAQCVALNDALLRRAGSEKGRPSLSGPYRQAG